MKEQLKSNHDSEYMLEAVPMDKRHSTWDQVMVWVGFGYVVTGLYVGGVLGGYGGSPGLPIGKAALALILGMGSLFLITSFLGIAAQKTGYNLSLLSRGSYGTKGMALPMTVMALLTLGWFASITGMVGDIWGAAIGNPSGVIVFNPSSYGFEGIRPITLETFLACSVWGIIFTISAAKGMKAMEAIAKPISPLIMVIAIIAGFMMLFRGDGVTGFFEKASQLDGLGLGTGITVVVGSWIAGAVMGVDLFRFNKNVKAVFLCAASCFILTNPILNIVGYIGAVQAGEFNYVIWFLGISMAAAAVGVFVWTTSLWTTNNAELYCNALYTGPVLDAFHISVNRKKLVIICGIIGTILGSLAFYQMFFATFITVLGAVAPPLTAPILADFFFVNKKKYDNALINHHPSVRYAGIITYVIGAVLGYLFQYVTPLPYGLPAGLAAMLISIVIYIIVYQITPDKKADADMTKSL